MPGDFHLLRCWQINQGGPGVWYKTIQTLGAGANAVTVRVVATSGPNKGVLFALKVFRKLSDPQRRAAFLGEVGFLKTCSHPSIMRVFDTGLFVTYDWGVKREYPFVVAEYLPNTLAHVIRAGDLTIPEKVSYSLQLLSGLVYLASLNPQVVHRDIKPSNIFLKGHSCVLGDFGLMKLLGGQEEPGRTLFKESAPPGMPYYYRTPDLVSYAKQEAQITTKSDVFQLGLVLAHLFTGWNPSEVSKDMLAPVVLNQLDPIHGELGAGVGALLRRMLVMDPAVRESAAELMDGWGGVFDSAIEMSHRLEGRAF